MVLGRGRSGGSSRERIQLRRELRALEDLREQELRHLGGLALEMHRRDVVDTDLLMEKADELAELEEEISLISSELGDSPDESPVSPTRRARRRPAR